MTKFWSLWGGIACFALVGTGAGKSANAANDTLQPRGEANWRYSNDRSILMSEFWVPIVQNMQDGSVIYGDVRLMGDNNDNNEFNIGAGYRRLLETSLFGDGIAGGLVWFDRRRTSLDSNYNQVTLGGEWLADQYDLRLNAYVPLNQDNSYTFPNPNGSNATFAGTQIVVAGDQTIVEEALPGLDFEVGYKLEFMEGYTDTTRVYAGAYHFEGSQSDDVSGWRARIASDITSDFQLGARFQHDNVRGSQGFLEATIRFPFGAKKQYQTSGLRSRLDEAPERDIDIVANQAVVEEGAPEILINTTTGSAQNVIHVDNTAAGGGDGSSSRPYNTLAAAQAAATNPYDLIYVHRGDGTTAGMNLGITLANDGMMLVGSSTSLVFDGGNFRSASGKTYSGGFVLKAQDSLPPVITNAAGNGITIMGDNVMVNGINITGTTSNGILAMNANNLTIKNVAATTSALKGFSGAYSDNRTHIVTISDSAFNSNTQEGIYFVQTNTTNMNALIDNNTINSNSIGLFALSGNVAVGNFTINSNNASMNATNFRYQLNNTSTGMLLMELNNSDSATVGEGVLVRIANTANLNYLLINDNTFSNSNKSGVRLDMTGATNATIANANISNNIFFGNNDYGIELNAGNPVNGTMIANIFGNYIYNNDRGVYLTASNNINISASLYNNSIFDNTSFGIILNDDSTGTVVFDLGGGSLGSLGQNSIYNDTMSFDYDGAEIKAENNWWGSIFGINMGDVGLDGATTIDAVPFLTADPN